VSRCQGRHIQFRARRPGWAPLFLPSQQILGEVGAGEYEVREDDEDLLFRFRDCEHNIMVIFYNTPLQGYLQTFFLSHVCLDNVVQQQTTLCRARDVSSFQGDSPPPMQPGSGAHILDAEPCCEFGKSGGRMVYMFLLCMWLLHPSSPHQKASRVTDQQATKGKKQLHSTCEV
jgi:hypothetical protein